MGDSLRECWRCLSDVRELVTDPIQNSLLGETPYSLRSCHMAMSSASAAVAPSRRPRACKRP